MKATERNRFTRWVDRVVEAFSPGAAVNREIARQKMNHFRYTGATSSRDRRQVNSQLQGAESATYNRDRIQLMREARNLEENGELANAILGKFDTHVTGRVHYQPETGSPRVDRAIARWWMDWAPRADYTQRHSLRKLAQLALRHTLTDGDAGLVPFVDHDGEAKVLGIEADRIGTPWDLQVNDNYAGGIHLNAAKQPTHFEIYQRDVHGTYSNPELIPASNFCHIANTNRFDRYRGVTAFAPVVDVAVDVQEIVQFEKLAVKWGSMQTGVVVGSPGGPGDDEFFNDGDFAGSGETKRIQEVAHGQLNYLDSKDASITQFKTERPGAAWEGFLQFLIRLYAAGVNLPYGFVFDISQSRGPGSRFEAEQARRTFELWQDLLVEKALDRIKNVALIAAVAAGRVPTHRNLLRGSWQFPRHPSIDVGRESAADVAEVEAGIKSQGTVLRKYALDAREERRRIAEEKKHWAELEEEHELPAGSLSGIGGGGKGKPQEGEEPQEKNGETQKQANGKAFDVVYLPERNGNAAPINVRTAPINLNLGKEQEERPEVEKEITFVRKNGKITGAKVLETPKGGGTTIKRKVKLEKGKRARIDGNDIVEIGS